WEAAIGDQAISLSELTALAEQKAPLVHYRGAWVAIDPQELSEIKMRIASGTEHIPLREAVRAALAGETRQGALSVTVSATGSLAELLERMRSGAASKIEAPATLNATLRPYQERGLAWLATMGSLGLGACLADDMGLGKTVELLAFLLQRLSAEPKDRRPSLLVV